ncbi:MAG: T9SS type A sorting domain-containing protein [Bacteroidota bacterium]|nr:T9SS type A sorting domain-containing protein [Bacteroidota bacterium]MDX5431450.1 T9SS type A sorting domain-containing protein [Bacteroidota bacterium]MDX5470178.1 T9SS type A sorting domain-containing protein [Bacteroidota bacterium]
MNKLILALVAVGMAVSSNAQLQNGDFENWSNLPGTSVKNPNNFITSNLSVYDGNDPSVLQINGSSGMGVRINNYEYIDEEMGDTILEVGFVMSGKIDILAGDFQLLVPVNGRPLTLKGKYNYMPEGNDELSFSLVLFKNGQPVGLAEFNSTDATNGFTEFSVNVDYSSTETPDSMTYAFRPSSDNPQLGSVLELDELELEMEGPNGIETVSLLEMDAYPNPAKEQLTLAIDERLLGADFTVIDLSGKVVMSGKMRDSKQIDLSGIKEGMYIVHVSNGQIHSSERITIKR